MTRGQHEATRELEHAEANWLRAYGWRQMSSIGAGSWSHPNAPQMKLTYTQRDALMLTRAEPLRFGAVR